MSSTGFEQIDLSKDDLVIQLFQFLQERLRGCQGYPVLFRIDLPVASTFSNGIAFGTPQPLAAWNREKLRTVRQA